MVLLHENVVGLDSAIFMHPTIWKASGHVDAFNDPLIDNRDSKKRYRADVLIEEQLAKYEDKINKEVEKATSVLANRLMKSSFMKQTAVCSNTRPNGMRFRLAIKALNDVNLEELKQIILDEEIVCPISGTRN